MNQQVIKTDRDRWHPNGCHCLHPPWDCPVQSLGVLGPPDGGLLLFHHPQYDRVRWRGAMSRSGVLGHSGQAHHVRPLSSVSSSKVTCCAFLYSRLIYILIRKHWYCLQYISLLLETSDCIHKLYQVAPLRKHLPRKTWELATIFIALSNDILLCD